MKTHSLHMVAYAAKLHPDEMPAPAPHHHERITTRLSMADGLAPTHTRLPIPTWSLTPSEFRKALTSVPCLAPFVALVTNNAVQHGSTLHTVLLLVIPGFHADFLTFLRTKPQAWPKTPGHVTLAYANLMNFVNTRRLQRVDLWSLFPPTVPRASEGESFDPFGAQSLMRANKRNLAPKAAPKLHYHNQWFMFFTETVAFCAQVTGVQEFVEVVPESRCRRRCPPDRPHAAN